MKQKDFWSTSVRYYNRKGEIGKEGIFLITGSTGLYFTMSHCTKKK